MKICPNISFSGQNLSKFWMKSSKLELVFASVFLVSRRNQYKDAATLYSAQQTQPFFWGGAGGLDAVECWNGMFGGRLLQVACVTDVTLQRMQSVR